MITVVGSPRNRIVVALLILTRISIFAYSAIPKSVMFRTLLTNRDGVASRSASELQTLLKTTAPAAAKLPDSGRTKLVRRRAIDDSDSQSPFPASQPPLKALSLDVLRGGAVAGQNFLVAAFCQFADYVGQTKARCFILLMFSVLIESYATTLSKQAKDTGNALLFARACVVYLMWYVWWTARKY